MLLSKFKILGHSMEPNIKNGQIVLISKLPFIFQKPKVNDIVAFEHGKEILVKRISKIEKESFFAKGDNAEDSFDSRKIGLISFDKILGKVIYKI